MRTCIWFGAALAVGLATAPQATAQAVKPKFTVEIPVLVLDKHGQPLTQLDQDQFRLTDNGRLQQVTRFERDPRPVALALVVDTSDPDAIAQAGRSAALITAMVIGDNGQASIYISGPQPKCVLPLTTDQDKFADALRHLTRTPQAPQGQGQITRSAELAMLALMHLPDSQSRAVAIIGKSADRSGAAAASLTETAMQNSISIFRISPNRLDNTQAPINPDSVAASGAGAGSQRDPNVAEGQPLNGEQAPKDVASVNLTPILSTSKHLAGDVVAPHDLDYVYDSGGLTLGSGNNAEFDRQMASIGADLRGLYRLYFQPDDIVPAPRRLRHAVSVSVHALPGAAAIGTVSYRRAYWGPAAVAMPTSH